MKSHSAQGFLRCVGCSPTFMRAHHGAFWYDAAAVKFHVEVTAAPPCCLSAAPRHFWTGEWYDSSRHDNPPPRLPHINHMPAGQTEGSGLQLRMAALQKLLTVGWRAKNLCMSRSAGWKNWCSGAIPPHFAFTLLAITFIPCAACSY